MNAKQLREALAEGKPIDVGQLVDLLERLEKALETANQKIAELSKENARLTKSNKLDQAFSVDAHEKRMETAEEST